MLVICGLYAITNETLMPGELLLKKAEAVLQGGCRLLQYRNKFSTEPEKIAEASALRELCHRYEAKLIVNDSLAVAQASGADGVHLGQDDESVATARQQLGAAAIVGATCHASLSLADTACDLGADYLAFGRFFPSSTKPDAPPADLQLLARVRQRLHLPVVAIGGINRDNAAVLIAAGADCLAISHDLFQGNDLAAIRQRATDYQNLFPNIPQEPQ